MNMGRPLPLPPILQPEKSFASPATKTVEATPRRTEQFQSETARLIDNLLVSSSPLFYTTGCGSTLSSRAQEQLGSPSILKPNFRDLTGCTRLTTSLSQNSYRTLPQLVHKKTPATMGKSSQQSSRNREREKVLAPMPIRVNAKIRQIYSHIAPSGSPITPSATISRTTQTETEYFLIPTATTDIITKTSTRESQIRQANQVASTSRGGSNNNNTVDACTSPINSPSSRSSSALPPLSFTPNYIRKLEDLEKITGHIIIQRFFTRTDDTFGSWIEKQLTLTQKTVGVDTADIPEDDQVDCNEDTNSLTIEEKSESKLSSECIVQENITTEYIANDNTESDSKDICGENAKDENIIDEQSAEEHESHDSRLCSLNDCVHCECFKDENADEGEKIIIGPRSSTPINELDEIEEDIISQCVVLELKRALEKDSQEVFGTELAEPDPDLAETTIGSEVLINIEEEAIDSMTQDEGVGDEMVGDEAADGEATGDEAAGGETAGDAEAGVEVAGDAAAGVEVAGDAAAGVEVAGDAEAGVEVADDAPAGDAVASDEAAGNETVGNTTGGNEAVGDEVVGDEETNDEKEIPGDENAAEGESIIENCTQEDENSKELEPSEEHKEESAVEIVETNLFSESQEINIVIDECVDEAENDLDSEEKNVGSVTTEIVNETIEKVVDAESGCDDLTDTEVSKSKVADYLADLGEIPDGCKENVEEGAYPEGEPEPNEQTAVNKVAGGETGESIEQDGESVVPRLKRSTSIDSCLGTESSGETRNMLNDSSSSRLGDSGRFEHEMICWPSIADMIPNAHTVNSLDEIIQENCPDLINMKPLMKQRKSWEEQESQEQEITIICSTTVATTSTPKHNEDISESSGEGELPQTQRESESDRGTETESDINSENYHARSEAESSVLQEDEEDDDEVHSQEDKFESMISSHIKGRYIRGQKRTISTQTGKSIDSSRSTTASTGSSFDLEVVSKSKRFTTCATQLSSGNSDHAPTDRRRSYLPSGTSSLNLLNMKFTVGKEFESEVSICVPAKSSHGHGGDMRTLMARRIEKSHHHQPHQSLPQVVDGRNINSTGISGRQRESSVAQAELSNLWKDVKTRMDNKVGKGTKESGLQIVGNALRATDSLGALAVTNNSSGGFTASNTTGANDEKIKRSLQRLKKILDT